MGRCRPSPRPVLATSHCSAPITAHSPIGPPSLTHPEEILKKSSSFRSWELLSSRMARTTRPSHIPRGIDGVLAGAPRLETIMRGSTIRLLVILALGLVAVLLVTNGGAAE